MQFPNGVNKSNLIKLGVLGAAYYLMKGRNTKPANKQIEQRQEQLDDNQERLDNNQKSLDSNEKLTPFQLGKQLAGKFLGKKF